MSRILILIVSLLFSLPFIAKAETPATPSPLPITAFSQLPQFKTPKLSPQGNRLAYVYNTEGKEPLSVLSTLDLTNGKRYLLLASDNEKVKINWFNWANEKTLLLSARYESKRHNLRYYETRMYAMDFDSEGKEPRNLIKPRKRGFDTRHNAQFQDNIIDWLRDDPDHILMAIDIDEPYLPSVYKVNVNNGKMSRVIKGKREIRDWLTDRQSNLRVGVTLNYKTGKRDILVKRTPTSEFETLVTYNTMTEPSWYPLGFGKDPNILYYRAYHNDKLALFSWDLSTDQQKLVFADENYDVDGYLLYSEVTNDVIGITHSESKTGRIYWDKRLVKLENGLDKVLPDTTNSLISFSRDEQRYIAYAESDTQPGAYFLGDRVNKSMNVLFFKHPHIKADRLTEHQLVTYQARDGITIEGFLTLPLSGEAPYPTIMHPHGGPGARDYGGFDLFTSFFANQGYAVFRPNFRGSSGYGYSFSQSQIKAWGEAMQDDITDGAHHLVKQGIADPKRFCIVGASYGGYAATMAAVKTPELFTCAVSFAGVTDLPKLITDSRQFLGINFVKNQIGDNKRDLKFRSPINHVEKVTIPMLLIHGNEDRVVNVEQSRRFVDEMEDEDKPVKYVELEAGDHYLSIQHNRTIFFEEVASFLNKHMNK